MKYNYANALYQMRKDLINEGYEQELDNLSVADIKALWLQEIDYTECSDEDF